MDGEDLYEQEVRIIAYTLSGVCDDDAECAQNADQPHPYLLELSDIYGAMVRYLEKHHTGMTMKDIKKMHKVTRRAFDNKRR